MQTLLIAITQLVTVKNVPSLFFLLQRDYGGPLVCQDGDIKVIVGVSVHGRGCARANQPGIFINVPFYTQWIYKVFKYYPNPEII